MVESLEGRDNGFERFARDLVHNSAVLGDIIVRLVLVEDGQIIGSDTCK
jgi:hypothetical protein